MGIDSKASKQQKKLFLICVKSSVCILLLIKTGTALLK